jgi:hypothetical protein
MRLVSTKPIIGRCLDCRHFQNNPAYFEDVFKGLSSFGSAFASVRSDDGLCRHHDRHVGSRFWCDDFAAREAR